MELELGLALHYNNNNNNNNNGVEIGKKSYPGFVDRDQHDLGDDEEEVESKGLSLLLWSGQPNEEDDDDPWRSRRRVNLGENEEENEEIVGWPPINSLRKELLHRHQGGPMANHRRQADHRVIIPRSSMYVKVKMEGVPIGRKIDLRLFNSYRALTNTLIDMFAKYNGNDNQHEEYTILYQDREGDWMLAGDVDWETFVESVQRMEIQRKNN
ncbi:hypothetical protein CASFOL_011219 [Castilleja foliolosa]|uniref:Auxin-responsive protein n=1 Tax=Castilleja foliolosa TaxID=1961234 RepID=A0ABD3DYM9_9LAMI